MAGTRLLRFFIPIVASVATLVAVCPAGAEVVALRRGAGTFGLFQNGQISPVFANKLPIQDGTGSNTITEITDASSGVNIVDDTKYWGGSDTDSSGIPTPRGGGNTWSEPSPWYLNNGASGRTNLNELSLLKFNVAQATGLIGGTVNKAELRLFFDDGFGPDPDDIGARDLGDQVGRITTFDWVEGNKDRLPPGFDDTANGGAPPAPGVSRGHPISTNTARRQDINNTPVQRTRGFWFDLDGVVDAGAGPGGEDLYRTLLPADFDSSGVFDTSVPGVCTVISDSRGVVDGADLARLQDNLGSTTPPATGFNWKYPLGDADMDGDVDGTDFLTWQENAGKTGVNIYGRGTASVDPTDCRQLLEDGTTVDEASAVTLRGWFGPENPGGDVTYQAQTWGDGNDYFNPDPVDYTSNPTDFPPMTVDGVTIYAPRRTAGNNGAFPASPTDGVSPGDGDVANEVNSIDATSLFPENFDMQFGETEAGPLGSDAGFDVWDLTQMIQSIADGADNFGFYVRDNLRTFALSETLNGLDFAPVLFIDYTPAAAAISVPEPSNIVLLGWIGFAGFTRNSKRANRRA